MTECMILGECAFEAGTSGISCCVRSRAVNNGKRSKRNMFKTLSPHTGSTCPEEEGGPRDCVVALCQRDGLRTLNY